MNQRQQLLETHLRIVGDVQKILGELYNSADVLGMKDVAVGYTDMILLTERQVTKLLEIKYGR